MRRSAWIFLAAILLPSLVLAFLAVRSARDQQVILQHQQAIISQDVTDALAKKVRDSVDNVRGAFVQVTDQLLQDSSTPQLAEDFNRRLHGAWGMGEVGFSVNLSGIIYSPGTYEGALARTFRNENDRFLSNRENVEVFAQAVSKEPKVLFLPQKPTSPKNALSPTVQQPGQSENEAGTQMQQAQRYSPKTRNSSQLSNSQSENQTQGRSPGQQQASGPQTPQSAQSPVSSSQSQNPPLLEPQRGVAQENSSQTQTTSPAAKMPSQAVDEKSLDIAPQMAKRQVEPQSQAQNAVSNTVGEQTDFRRVIGDATSGALARFLEDNLRLMVWYRPSQGPLVFGAQIMRQKLVESLQPLLDSPDLQKAGNANATYCLAILDDHGKPVLLSQPGFTADWKHPFVATEIGEALPHWEAALYLLDPGQINRSASTLQLALGLIVVVLVAAILLGGWLMAADVRRQMRLAQQKTDFVSNVSHELKTPLTSIRMFADMLAEGRVTEQDRQRNYLRIISAESARLTRLINNVLDFARMERGAPSGERRPCELVDVVKEVVSTCRPHLEAVGIPLSLEMEAEELPLIADRDALAQILLNLISNAEKYGGKEILLYVRREKNSADSPGVACVDVLDRGPGIPPRKRETIFQPFQRLDDSLASAVSGSGLGLTLARRMARAHGGDVTYSPRAGGGSCFTLTVPLQAVVKTT